MKCSPKEWQSLNKLMSMSTASSRSHIFGSRSAHTPEQVLRIFPSRASQRLKPLWTSETSLTATLASLFCHVESFCGLFTIFFEQCPARSCRILRHLTLTWSFAAGCLSRCLLWSMWTCDVGCVPFTLTDWPNSRSKQTHFKMKRFSKCSNKTFTTS